MKECSKCKEVKKIEEFYYKGNQCKKCQIERQKIYIIKNKEKGNKRSLEYYYKNCKELNLHHKFYVEKTKEQRNKYWREYSKNRWENDPKYKIQKLLRKHIYYYLKSKSKKTEELLGYSYEKFLEILGEVPKDHHLDHKIPISWFNPNTPISVIWSLENLHYISSLENYSKNNRFSHHITGEYKNSIKSYIKSKYQSKL
jgi:hypothetical protein